MAADRHLEFSKFGILVMYPVLERDSALSYKNEDRQLEKLRVKRM